MTALRRAHPRVLQDHVRSLFADHHYGGIGVAGNQTGHDGTIDHPQSLNAAHPQALVDDRTGAFDALLPGAVAEVVTRQVRAGMDQVNDGCGFIGMPNWS